MELCLLFCPQLLHDQDCFSRLRPAMVKISADELRLFPMPARADAKQESAAAEQVKCRDFFGE